MLVAQQEVVFEGSKSLCLATNNKAYFGNVTIVIPDDWVEEGENVDGMTWPRNFQADVVVNEEHPVFGAKPFTLQYGSCGMGGLPIQTTYGDGREPDLQGKGKDGGSIGRIGCLFCRCLVVCLQVVLMLLGPTKGSACRFH